MANTRKTAIRIIPFLTLLFVLSLPQVLQAGDDPLTGDDFINAANAAFPGVVKPMAPRAHPQGPKITWDEYIGALDELGIQLEKNEIDMTKYIKESQELKSRYDKDATARWMSLGGRRSVDVPSAQTTIGDRPVKNPEPPTSDE